MSKAQFIDFKQPELKVIDKYEYYLKDDYSVVWKKGRGIFSITVPSRLNTDIATTPKWAAAIGVTHDGKHRAAAVVHDWLYMTQGFKRFRDLCKDSYRIWDEESRLWKPLLAHWDRSDCDKIFLLLMEEAGVSWLRRSIYYRAVRIFGKSYWLS